jgi:hypothetical protein
MDVLQLTFLLLFINQKPLEEKIIYFRVHEATEGIKRGAYNGLPPYIERGVDQNRAAGFFWKDLSSS